MNNDNQEVPPQTPNVIKKLPRENNSQFETPNAQQLIEMSYNESEPTITVAKGSYLNEFKEEGVHHVWKDDDNIDEPQRQHGRQKSRVKKVLFNDSFKRNMNNPHYDEEEEEIKQIREHFGQDGPEIRSEDDIDFMQSAEELGFESNRDNMHTDRELYRMDTERKLVKKDGKGRVKRTLTRSTKGSTEMQDMSFGNTEAEDNSFANRRRQQRLNGTNQKSFDFNKELSRLNTIQKVENKLKKTGTDPESLLFVKPRRSFLDRVRIPKKIKCKLSTRLQVDMTYIYCVFLIAIVDFFSLFKTLCLISEHAEYSADYPTFVAIDVYAKLVIHSMLFAVECYCILSKHKFSYCKMAYALKLLEIIFVLVAAFATAGHMREQCSKWLKNPNYNFKRDSEESNSHKLMTMVFYCSFEKVFEQKEREKTEDTVSYFKYNTALSNSLLVVEILYCLLCMGIFLVIIYWNQEGRKSVILGLEEGESDEEDELVEEIDWDQIRRSRDIKKKMIEASVLGKEGYSLNESGWSKIYQKELNQSANNLYSKRTQTSSQANVSMVRYEKTSRPKKMEKFDTSTRHNATLDLEYLRRQDRKMRKKEYKYLASYDGFGYSRKLSQR